MSNQSQFESLGPDQLSELRREINQTLSSLGVKYGIDMSTGKCTYNATECTFQLKCVLKGKLTAEEKILRRMVEKYDIDLDKVYDGYIFVGYKTRNRKYKWIVKKDGKQYKITQEHAMKIVTHTQKTKVDPEYKCSIRFISDRQDLLECIKVRELGLERYVKDRIDMYWVNVESGDNETSSYLIEPRVELGKIKWICVCQYGPAPGTKRIAEDFFKGSKYEKQQEEWMKKLLIGGYFETGRYPGKNTGRCKHCECTFAVGTSHEHIRFDNGIHMHNARQYKNIQDHGLTVTWSPGYKLEDSSLEEIGELERYVISSNI